MDQIMDILQQLRQENLQLRQQMNTLQHHSTSVNPRPIPTPKISLPDKFDGSRRNLRAFLNQVRLVVRMQPDRYPDDERQVGLLGSLLTGPASNWFAPLLERDSPLLRNFEAFVTDLEATFGDTDRIRSAKGKLRNLRQGNRPASQYASEFRLIAGDTNWNDDALMAQFRIGLNDDVKDLLLTMEDPLDLQQLITHAVKCDNRLFERRMERNGKANMSRTPATLRFSQTVTTPTPPPSRPTPQQYLPPGDPMQLDTVRIKHLTPAEKQRRRQENLCLYCGKPNHIASNCPEKPSLPRTQPTYKAYSGQVPPQTINSEPSPQENFQAHLQ